MRKMLIYTGLMVLWVLCLTLTEGGADVVVAEEEIHTAVTDYVRGALSEFGGEVEVSVRRRGDLTVEGTGAVGLRVRPSRGRSSARQVPVVLEVHRGEKVVGEYLMVADVRYFDRVIVASRPIMRGEPITDGAVAAERREVTTILGRYVTDLSKLEGMRAKMRIGFGRPVGKRYLERIPAVERGDMVRIRADVGTVTASTVGVANASGAVGERILVRNLSSRQKILAEVVAPGVVRVVF